MKVQTRLFILVGILTLFLAIVGILGLSAARNANAGLDTVYNDRVLPLDQLKKISDMYAVNIVDTCHKVRNGNLDWNDGFKNISEAKKIIEENWRVYIGTSLVEQEKALIRELEPLFRRADSALAVALNIMKNRNSADITRFTVSEMYPAIDPVTDKIDQLIKVQLLVAKDEYTKSEALYIRNRTISIAVILFAIFVSVAIALMIVRNLLRQLGGEPSDVVAIAKHLAEGDLTARVAVRKGDSSSALYAMKNMNEGLKKMISDVVAGSQSLVQTIQEISAGNENLSQRTAEQASSLEEVASIIEQSVASIRQNAENSIKANEFSTKTLQIAEEGGRVVNDAVAAINEINESSKKIEQIITVINEISFQTNLLALNAAVEAARAGEQGRGFAVVAGEVRNLAQRSGGAAKEIDKLIKSTMQKVDRGTSLANHSGEALKDIISSVRDVGKLVSEISAGNEEQKQGSAQINIAISELDSMTQQNAGLVEENAAASEGMSNQAQDLLLLMKKFKIEHEKKSAPADGITIAVSGN